MRFFSFHLMPYPGLPPDYDGPAWITCPNSFYDPAHEETPSGPVPSVAALAVTEAARVGLETSLLDRPLNVDLSGGERKRSETLQLAVLQPSIAVLDEIDSGIDVDGLRDVARRVQAGVDEWGLGVLAITHYRRLLSVLRPDAVHVLVRGRIVASGGPELADELERTGYVPYEATNEPPEPSATGRN